MSSFEIKKINSPVILNTTKSGNSTHYLIKQKYSINSLEVEIKHYCFAFNDGSTTVTDFDNEKFQSLNGELEQQLLSHYGDSSKAFEVYELMSMEASNEALSVL